MNDTFMNGGKAAQIVGADGFAGLIELSRLGIPSDEAELQNRIDAYFQICSEKGFALGIESLAMSLGVTRQTLWKWSNGSRGEQWAQIVERAKQVILSFTEQLALTGRVNPAITIFLLKNYGYSDKEGFDDRAGYSTRNGRKRTPEEIAEEMGILPVFDADTGEWIG